MNTGDPITNTGWLDSHCGDIIFMQGSGSFSMAPLDTQRVLYAIIVGHSNDRLSSVLDLRGNTDFIRNAVATNYDLQVTAETEVDYLSAIQSDVYVEVKVNSSNVISSVTADFYSYDDAHFMTLQLSDDGQNDNGIAGDNVFGQSWSVLGMDDVLYVNITVHDNINEYLYRYADYNINLSDKINFNSLEVVDDHINQDLEINPGENIRLCAEFDNGYEFTLRNVRVYLESTDQYVTMNSEAVRIDSLLPGEAWTGNYDLNDENTYFEFNVDPDIPDTHTINFIIRIFDDKFHHWERSYSLQVSPLEYQPNIIIPAHVAGRSDAKFTIKVIYPNELTGNAYALTVSESINEAGDQGFNLINQSTGDTLLKDHEVPDAYAYNIPITDGFKVIEAYLPADRIEGRFENIAGGHPTPFHNIDGAGNIEEWIFSLGLADAESFVDVELEFTDVIDDAGVIGGASGQYGFQYLMIPYSFPTGFYRCPFDLWKVENGHRVGKLNVGFQEFQHLPGYDETWTPGEEIAILITDYDSTGTYYDDPAINPLYDLMYKVRFTLRYESSVVDAGDKIFIHRIFKATSEDLFMFTPTNADENKPDLPNDFCLYQNYPNPFNPETMIKFSINQFGSVTLKIYNLMGQEIITILDKTLNPGEYSVLWNGRDAQNQQVCSGLYFVRLKNGEREHVIKMLLIR